ncbi:MAG: hypothetical protein AAB527_03795 [Patescibacteria group bacterium]
MAMNLLPREYQEELKSERIKRLAAATGVAFFLIGAVNIILLLPSWVLFEVQEREMLRQLDALKKNPAFSRIADIEYEIGSLNSEIRAFNDLEKRRFEIAQALMSVLDSRPAGISVTNIVFSVADPKRSQPSQISVQGTAVNRDLLLKFAATNETNTFFKKVNSPISNLLKEANLNYSLVLDLANESR